MSFLRKQESSTRLPQPFFSASPLAEEARLGSAKPGEGTLDSHFRGNDTLVLVPGGGTRVLAPGEGQVASFGERARSSGVTGFGTGFAPYGFTERFGRKKAVRVDCPKHFARPCCGE